MGERKSFYLDERAGELQGLLFTSHWRFLNVAIYFFSHLGLGDHKARLPLLTPFLFL